MIKKRVLLLRSGSSKEQEGTHPRSCCLPWTLKYIQSLLRRKNIPVKFFDLRVKQYMDDEVLSLISEYDPTYIVIQVNSLEYSDCERILKKIRRFPQYEVILVGQYPTYCGNFFGKEVFFKGESELAVTEYITTGNKGIIDRSKLNIVDNLTELPFPHYQNQELSSYYYHYPLKIWKKVIWGSLLATRGCPHNCIFCTQILRESYGKKVRFREVENVIKEIEYLKSLGANVISFEDDSLVFSRQYTESICEHMIRENIRLPWICQARVDELDFEFLQKMKQAGCILIRLGVESGSPRVLELIKKTDKGQDWINRSQEVFSWTRRLGIATDAMFIIGSPTETEREIEMSMKLARDLQPDMLQVCIFTPYPGAPAYQEYKESLPSSSSSVLYHYDDNLVNLSKVSNDKLMKLQKKFYRHVIFRLDFLLRHALNYTGFYFLNYKRMAKVLNLRNFLNFN